MREAPLPSPAERRRFRTNLLSWYRRNGRDLPWRNTTDPYHVLVSEMMLQQTQVDRVLPKYHEWLGNTRRSRRWPPPTKPTSAPRGARSATTSGPSACTRSRGSRWRPTADRLPSDEQTLLSFKGIGAYTAGAIRSFAFGQRAPILDTNVARVLFRVFIAKGDPKSHAMKRQLWRHSEAVLPFRHVYDFNQALMDLGATVCVARGQKCGVCPMRRFCRSSQTRRKKA